MPKFAKKPKEAEHHEEEHEEEVPLEPPEPESPPVKDTTPDVREIEIKGAKYRVGTAVTLGEHEATVVDERALKSSANAGVSGGIYPIVSITLKPGNRIAYRALVSDLLYPIRGYGTPNEVISKIRGEAKESSKDKKARAASAQSADERGAITLTSQAAKTLDTYLSIKGDADQEVVLSALVVEHLGPQVARMEAAREAIQKLPMDLLTALAGASAETRQKVLELLK